ncbi:hypothetical protein CEXT_759521 [Caerostris extrusa]|uniref:Uncharacterized protein n=1 Tax=Caerostris extrusa TaxID=172846 RepID=A0AAV4MCL1_CAEEX|nr:hypothetical protein CEXT_759521 [Caerostris extrusa]
MELDDFIMDRRKEFGNSTFASEKSFAPPFRARLFRDEGIPVICPTFVHSLKSTFIVCGKGLLALPLTGKIPGVYEIPFGIL